jgi:hypothetical protein
MKTIGSMNIIIRVGLLVAAAGAVSSCHVGGGYTVGGTVTGVRSTGLVLQDDSGDNLTITGNGTFAFSSGIDQGGTYSVTVLTQPSNPTAQTCVVHNGSGTIGTADITNVIVHCSQAGQYAPSMPRRAC